MSRIVIDSEIDRQQWRELVQRSATGTWFQLPEAYDFFASLPALMEPFAYGVEKGENLCAVCVGYVTRERNSIKQFFTCRAIINGGPAIAEDCAKGDVAKLLSYIREQFQSETIYIETRNFHDFTPWKEAFEEAGFAYKKHLNFHFDCRDLEALFARLSETRRRQIHKAQKNDVVIEEARNEREIADWYGILSDLYRRKVKTPLFPLSFFLTFFRQNRGIFLLVKTDGKVIGGMMCPILGDQCIYEWYICGMDSSYKWLSPSVMATWAAMEYAHKQGITRFDIMGAGEPGVPYGVRDFKAEFGGTLVEHGRFLCICQPTLYRFGAWVVQLIKRF